jgi:hypothetical protein
MTAVDTETTSTAGVAAAVPRHRRVLFTPRVVAYLLIAPTALVLAGVEGYPLVRLVVLSFQDLTQRELFSGAGSATTRTSSAMPSSGRSCCGPWCSRWSRSG